MGQSCSSTLCLGEGNDVALANSFQRRDSRLSNQSQQQQHRTGTQSSKKKSQKKRGVALGSTTSECADPKMYNLMTQSILQQQMLYHQQQQHYQPQPLPVVATSKSQPQVPAVISLGGQSHLLYRKHPKSILALTGSSSSAQPSQNLAPSTPNSLPPWGVVPRRKIPTKLIVRRPRRGTFPLSYQDEGLSGTQIYAIRYWVDNCGPNAKDNIISEPQHSAYQTSTGGRIISSNSFDEYEAEENDDDQDCIWMMMQDEDDDDDDDEEDEDAAKQRSRQRQQEQYPGRRKGAGSNLLSQSAAATALSTTAGALPTLLPIYHTKSGGSFGYSTSVPSSAFRDLERNTRMRLPSSTLTTTINGSDLTDFPATGDNDTTAACSTTKGASIPSTRRTDTTTSNWASAAATSTLVKPSAAAWSSPNPSATTAATAVPNGDFFTPQALAMRQPRPVLDWITISEEYNIHVADVGLTPAECDHLVQVTEQVCRGQYAAYTYAKQTLGCREFPTLAQACLEPVHAVVEAIRTYTTIHPHNSSAYFGCTNLQLDDREPHMVKYDVTKKERQKLDMHTDKSEWTFLIALSNGGGLDYDGGGTFFECLDATIHVQRGHALIFPGKLRHCGQRITSGLRFILVGFLVDKPMLPLGGSSSATSNLLAASARCSGPMAIPPDHHRA